MDGWLTTHVLDTARGCPAAGVEIALFRLGDGARREIARARTNADGRTDAPILGAERFAAGEYELLFEAGAYLAATGQGGGFLGAVPVRFAMREAGHYHVPLLLSPFGYSTYRGS